MDAARNPPNLRPEPAGDGTVEFVPMCLRCLANELRMELVRPDVLIGRHTEADIRLPLPDISRYHCRLRFIEGHWQVVDLGSMNGVYVNDARVEQSELHIGDILRVGCMRFEVVPAKPDSTANEPAFGREAPPGFAWRIGDGDGAAALRKAS